MRFVKDSYLADVSITASACWNNHSLRIIGIIGAKNIDYTAVSVREAREYLDTLQKHFGNFAVFDMTERILK